MKVVIESTRSFFSLLHTDDEDDTTSLSIQECTMELRASMGNHIRFVFYSISNTRDDYDQDYYMSMPKAPCLKIRDVCSSYFYVISYSFYLESGNNNIRLSYNS